MRNYSLNWWSWYKGMLQLSLFSLYTEFYLANRCIILQKKQLFILNCTVLYIDCNVFDQTQMAFGFIVYFEKKLFHFVRNCCRNFSSLDPTLNFDSDVLFLFCNYWTRTCPFNIHCLIRTPERQKWILRFWFCFLVLTCHMSKY